MRLSALILIPFGTASVLAVPSTGRSQDPRQTSPAASADTLARLPFEIPAQSLTDALVAFREQSGLQVDADSTVIARLRSAPVVDTISPAEALRRLLAGTGVIAHFLDARTAVLHANLPAGAQTLEPVEIVSTRRAGYAASRTTTATKTATPLRDVPQSVSVITRDLIQDLSMQDMGDVVRFVPGVTMGQGEGNRDQPTIRGNNTTADFFVDGVRDDVQYFRDLYNMERVEAFKGSNAMIFGRGGGGGVLNRVTKEADWTSLRELTLQGGSFDNKRASIDVGGGLSESVAARLNGMVERSGLFRDRVTIERSGINPTLTITPASRRTRVSLGYELFDDRRTADRGIPSFAGRPITTDRSTFFGDPDASWADVRAHVGVATVTHEATGELTIRNRTQLGSYDKFYQNVFPGAVNAAGDEVSISAYNNATQRMSLFNQTDITLDVRTGSIGHTLLVGAEMGRQATDNLRHTGYFDNTSVSVSAPVTAPTISVPLTFRPSATDADNHVDNTVASLYLQDQVALSRHLQLIAGLRYERFNLEYRNNRTASTLRRVDGMIAPRFGAIVKPIEALSFYASHGVSFLPASGDQFSSLTDVTQGLAPERFTNSEVGAKWDVVERLAFTGALYRLDRTNTRAPDPADPTRTVLTGSQRSEGVELSAAGSITSAWEVVGSFASQRATITSTTTAATEGASVPLVPRSTLSLWNRYQIAPSLGVGVALVHRSDMFAAIDEKVTLPGYTEVDAAVYLRFGRYIRAQANVENLLDIEYFPTAHSNNNISPGSRRGVRVSLTTAF